MTIFPSLWARVFVAALAVTAVPASFAKTPADQLIVGMSMINPVSYTHLTLPTIYSV